MANLDRFAKNESPEFGELKMTIAQFFRINGGTTQLRGVIPDISLPSFNDDEDFGNAAVLIETADSRADFLRTRRFFVFAGRAGNSRLETSR